MFKRLKRKLKEPSIEAPSIESPLDLRIKKILKAYFPEEKPVAIPKDSFKSLESTLVDYLKHVEDNQRYMPTSPAGNPKGFEELKITKEMLAFIQGADKEMQQQKLAPEKTSFLDGLESIDE